MSNFSLLETKAFLIDVKYWLVWAAVLVVTIMNCSFPISLIFRLKSFPRIVRVDTQISYFRLLFFSSFIWRVTSENAVLINVYQQRLWILPLQASFAFHSFSFALVIIAFGFSIFFPFFVGAHLNNVLIQNNIVIRKIFARHLDFCWWTLKFEDSVCITLKTTSMKTTLLKWMGDKDISGNHFWLSFLRMTIIFVKMFSE